MPLLERRIAPRFVRFLPATLRHSGVETTGKTESVSRHGIFVACDRFLPTGSMVEVLLTLPAGEVLRTEQLELTATVAWALDPSLAQARGKEPGLGLRLYLIGARDKTLWDAYIEKLEADPRLTSLEPLALPQLQTLPDEPLHLLLKAHTQEALEHFIWGQLQEDGICLRAPLLGPLEQRIDVVIVHPHSDAECLIPGVIAAVTDHGEARVRDVRIEVLEPLAVLHQRLVGFSRTGESSVPVWAE